MVKVIWDVSAQLGEGPVWVDRMQSIVFVDIKSSKIHAHNLTSQENLTWQMDQPVTSIVVTAEGKLWATGRFGFYALELEKGGSALLKTIALPANIGTRIRFNDGKLAPDGHYWAGTMDDQEEQTLGEWWRLSPSGQVSLQDSGYKVTNGPTFCTKRNKMWATDSALQTIFVSEGWAEGALADKQVFRIFEDGDGYPDGMTIGPSGSLWVAFWDGACVRELDTTTGATLRQIDLPVTRPTSCTFGPDTRTLFVTSAAIGLPEAAGRPEGALLAIDISQD
jgi:xylono-1,5-lactonase